MTAENMETRSRAMRLLSVEQLCSLLRHALLRLKALSGVEPFVRAVDPSEFPAYRHYVTNPMDLFTLEKNIRKKQYGSTEAFLSDLKWILHNCIVFNSSGSKLSNIAKQLVKACKHEMQEIENCPDCYTNAHTKKDSWFIDACRIPHLLVWAKLKGFPFWPAKAMRVNAEEHVDVRFFGAHDRAWVPSRDVFIYSEDPPVPIKNKKKGNLEGCIQEVELYIKNITEKCGEFRFAPHKTPFDAKREEEQIKLLYPKCTLPFDIGPVRSRARSLSFSGSERSQSRPPSPMEEEASKKDSSEDPSNKSSTNKQETNEQESEDVSKDSGSDPTGVEVERKGDGGEEGEKSKKKEGEALAEEEEEEVDDVEPEEEKKGGSSDRGVAASPPCEVSSTTASTETMKAGSTDSSSLVGREEPSKPEPKLAVIAETSETVIIEGDIDDVEEEEEEEIDDDEEAADIQEIDDVEPEGTAASNEKEETSKDPPKKDEESSKELAQEVKDNQERKEESSVKGGEPTGTPPPPPSDTPPAAEPASSNAQNPVAPGMSVREEEIDDVEPEVPEPMEVVPSTEESPPDAEKRGEKKAVVQEGGGESAQSDEQPPLLGGEGLDTSRLLASGVSVTIKSKPLPKEAAGSNKAGAEDPKEDLNSELSLGSDISVTVVQKKKDGATAAGNSPPRISVKKESELLDKSRDVVHVSRTKKGPRKSMDEEPEGVTTAGGPPDPIVTISKVQALVSGVHLPSAASKSGEASHKSASSSIASSAPPLSNQRSNKPSAPSSAAGGRTAAPPSMNMLPGGPRMHMHRGRAMSQSSHHRPGVPPMGGMPSLHPRPQGIFSVPPPLPSAAGPVSEQLNRVAGKLVDYMRLSLEELFREMACSGSPEATVKALQIEIEKMQWRHQQELAETRHNTELKFQELQHAMEAEKAKIISDLKKQAELDKQKAVGDTKKKQWCAHCGKEAIFYCCWNTSYCDYPCQQAHWPTHMSTCAQNQANNEEDGLNNSGGSSEISTSHASSEPHDHPGHFLSSNSAGGGSSSNNRSQSNGMMPPHAASRGMQPMMMPFGHSGINPRLMSQMSMRFVGPPPHGGPRGGSLPSHLRFPGNYFM
eukprot:TRINITY_DN4230_c0_g1_i1.p1 TRINITY_DN4230_c0_g1~~TRINITY_DN4230_c0_g1_i1.p1  ORF type:complete len:1231 (+),score=443.26 TRINITY_DN4230_c0_g1_i1:392-3694(+)